MPYLKLSIKIKKKKIIKNLNNGATMKGKWDEIVRSISIVFVCFLYCLKKS